MTFDLSAARDRLALVDPLLQRSIDWDAALEAPAPTPRAKRFGARSITPFQRETLISLIRANGGSISGGIDVANAVRGLRLRLGDDAVLTTRGVGYRLESAELDRAKALLK